MPTVIRAVKPRFDTWNKNHKIFNNPNCDIPKHFIRDPAAFKPDPMSATFLRPVLSISHMAGKTSGINVAM